MITFFMLMLIWGGQNAKDQIPPQSPPDTNYRAAKYSTLIDLTYAQDLVPGLRSNIISHQYFIQYGENVTIDIMFPESGVDYLPAKIVTWDYTAGIFTAEFYFNNVMTYYIGTDSIRFSREESRGIVERLCDPDSLSSRCDSMRFTAQPSNDEYLVYVNDSLANISSRYLFYPDIKNLPYKVIRNNHPKSIRTLEKMVYGKEAIDSFIQEFRHEEYERISEEEWNSYGQQLPDEVKEVLQRVQERTKE